jgi:hypothetical protein
VPVDGEPTATPALSDIDPGARLSGLVIKGRRYSVTAVGLQPEPVDA